MFAITYRKFHRVSSLTIRVGFLAAGLALIELQLVYVYVTAYVYIYMHAVPGTGVELHAYI